MSRRVPRVDRSLEPLLRTIAADTQAWLPLVRFAQPRVCVPFDVGDGLQGWLLTWMPGQRTGFHDHGGAPGAFIVLRGRVDEMTVAPSGRLRTRRRGRGRIASFPADHIHDIGNNTLTGAVSLHVYRPRLDRMTHYEARDGVLHPTRTDQAGVHW